MVGGRTEKARPWAWLWLWYGSCPTMTTLTLFKGVCWVLNSCKQMFPKIANRKCAIPRINLILWRKDLHARVFLFLEEPLQFQKLRSHQFLLKPSQPALIHGVNLELKQSPLLQRQRIHPFLLVEVGGHNTGRFGVGVRGFSLGGTEERGDATGFGFLAVCCWGFEMACIPLGARWARHSARCWSFGGSAGGDSSVVIECGGAQSRKIGSWQETNGYEVRRDAMVSYPEYQV